MRTLLISDLHADPSAFDHVLRQSEHAWDTIVSLGDLVGYGGEPEEVVQMLRQLNPYVTLKGNHEEMVVRVASGNPPELDTKTLQMVERQVAALSQQSLDFLAGLPEKHLTPGWGAVHGTPQKPSLGILAQRTGGQG
jgi:predicted phosphodiesterase